MVETENLKEAKLGIKWESWASTVIYHVRGLGWSPWIWGPTQFNQRLGK